MSEIGLQPPVEPDRDGAVAYHSACSLQHGQKIRNEPKHLLRDAGFIVLDPPEGHLCCGSAGTYNLLQPEIAGRLRDRKVANIESTAPDLIAAGNIGCITQIAGRNRRCPSCTRPSCSTGRPAGRGPAVYRHNLSARDLLSRWARRWRISGLRRLRRLLGNGRLPDFHCKPVSNCYSGSVCSAEGQDRF